MTFDAADKQYQLKDDIMPDKESTWKYPPEKDGKQSHRLLAIDPSRPCWDVLCHRGVVASLVGENVTL